MGGAAGEDLEGPAEDRRAVVGRGLEGRLGDDQPVEGEDAEARRGALREVAQQAGPGRAVDEHPVAVAEVDLRDPTTDLRVKQRDHPRLAVDDAGDRGDELVVEEGVQPGAVGGAPVGLAGQSVEAWRAGHGMHPITLVERAARGFREDVAEGVRLRAVRHPLTTRPARRGRRSIAVACPDVEPQAQSLDPVFAAWRLKRNELEGNVHFLERQADVQRRVFDLEIALLQIVAKES